MKKSSSQKEKNLLKGRRNTHQERGPRGENLTSYWRVAFSVSGCLRTAVTMHNAIQQLPGHRVGCDCFSGIAFSEYAV